MLESDAAGSRPAQGVERFGLHRLAVHEIGVAGLLGEALGHPGPHDRQQAAVGVEHAVHVPDVPGPVGRVENFGGAKVPVVAALEPVVVGDVAGRLLQVRHQPSPLEHLGEHVGGLLAGQVHAPQLGHRIVAVLDEDLLVELLGPLEAYGRIQERSPEMSRSPTNSSRNSRRRLFGERE